MAVPAYWLKVMVVIQEVGSRVSAAGWRQVADSVPVLLSRGVLPIVIILHCRQHDFGPLARGLSDFLPTNAEDCLVTASCPAGADGR